MQEHPLIRLDDHTLSQLQATLALSGAVLSESGRGSFRNSSTPRQMRAIHWKRSASSSCNLSPNLPIGDRPNAITL